MILIASNVRREVGNLGYVTDKQRPALKRALVRGSQRVVSTAKRNLRDNNSVRTGLLRRSITKEVKVEALEVSARVGTNVEYSSYVETGTKAHKIAPRNKSVLKFKIGGVWVFAKQVNHPGSKAKPYLVPALNINEPLIMNDIVSELNKVRYLK